MSARKPQPPDAIPLLFEILTFLRNAVDRIDAYAQQGHGSGRCPCRHCANDPEGAADIGSDLEGARWTIRTLSELIACRVPTQDFEQMLTTTWAATGEADGYSRTPLLACRWPADLARRLKQVRRERRRIRAACRRQYHTETV